MVNCHVRRHVSEKVTKRIILSISHNIFELIGSMCSVTLKPKLLLREIWSTKEVWDDDVSDDIGTSFKLRLRDLVYFADVKIQLCLFDGLELGKWPIHTFCDASDPVYAASVFLRVELEGKVCMQLIQAKSRVAPVMYVPTTRLELLSDWNKTSPGSI